MAGGLIIITLLNQRKPNLNKNEILYTKVPKSQKQLLFVFYLSFHATSCMEPYGSIHFQAWKQHAIIVWTQVVPCMELHGMTCCVGSGYLRDRVLTLRPIFEKIVTFFNWLKICHSSLGWSKLAYSPYYFELI